MTTISAFVAACSMLVVAVSSAGHRQPSPSASKPAPLDIVEVVGCLERSGDNAWMLVKAGSPTVTRTQLTTTSEVKAAAAKPLGNKHFRLLGLEVFKPSSHQGAKVVLKGVLIKNADQPRINVTSIQTVAPACS